tara:strand:- start:12 stop:581 length:570 start_codon:yes stop_codon:yes gene_type:complete
MYRHNPDITAMSPYDQGEDKLVRKFIKEEGLEDVTLIVGYDQLTYNNMREPHQERFDKEFYTANSIPWNARFEQFEFQRDKDKELEVYNKLNPTNEDYIFYDRVDLSKVRQDLKIIENPIEYNVFDLLTLIENASEVHLMESSIKCLVNSYKFTRPKFFYHQYVRNYDEYHNTQGLNDFTTIRGGYILK